MAWGGQLELLRPGSAGALGRQTEECAGFRPQAGHLVQVWRAEAAAWTLSAALGAWALRVLHLT